MLIWYKIDCASLPLVLSLTKPSSHYASQLHIWYDRFIFSLAGPNPFLKPKATLLRFLHTFPCQTWCSMILCYRMEKWNTGFSKIFSSLNCRTSRFQNLTHYGPLPPLQVSHFLRATFVSKYFPKIELNFELSNLEMGNYNPMTWNYLVLLSYFIVQNGRIGSHQWKGRAEYARGS